MERTDMVVIRLARHGAKKKPFYRIVATDSRNPRDGRFIEILGHYNPVATDKALTMKTDRIQHWIDNGAQPSATVARLIKKHAAAA
jgi:small subunit ribosomal protein S16